MKINMLDYKIGNRKRKMSYLVNFDNMLWNEPSKGIRTKIFISGNQQIRLVEFSEGFTEQDWCIKGHTGYVLNGEFSIDYNGFLEKYKEEYISMKANGTAVKFWQLEEARERAAAIK
jgi:hypothetical protein